MAKLDIIVAGNPVLRLKAKEVERIDKKTVRLLNVGVSRRIVVIDVGEGLIELINPVITKREGSVVGGEGCLSVPNFEGEVERAEYIECEFFDRKGKRMKLASDGILAIAVQHELDHLDGILFIDKATVLTPKETVPVGIE